MSVSKYPLGLIRTESQGITSPSLMVIISWLMMARNRVPTATRQKAHCFYPNLVCWKYFSVQKICSWTPGSCVLPPKPKEVVIFWWNFDWNSWFLAGWVSYLCFFGGQRWNGDWRKTMKNILVSKKRIHFSTWTATLLVRWKLFSCFLLWNCDSAGFLSEIYVAFVFVWLNCWGELCA